MYAPAQIQARFVLQHPGFCLDVDLQLPGRGITALFGHSGSGKTSCLRCFAGLEQAGTGYLQKAAPLYFRYVNTHQDQIERGRMLTLAELGPDQTVRSYRESTIAKRLGALDGGTPEQKARTCQGALAFLGGMTVPGEWPSRD